MAGDDITDQLPPRPDAQTGEPRPPAAPTQHAEGYNERKPSRVPRPPKGQSPVLEYYRASRLSVWLTAPVPVVVIVVALVLHSGIHALGYWQIWLLLAGYFAFLIYASRSEVVTAGADWVRFRRHWVRTYELTSIRLVARGANGHDLVLEDRDGRAVGAKPYLFQANRRLWDLVHLGMRHSAANGAEVNRPARGTYPEVAAASLQASKSRSRTQGSDSSE